MDPNEDMTVSQNGLKTSTPSQDQGRDQRARAVNNQERHNFQKSE